MTGRGGTLGVYRRALQQVRAHWAPLILIFLLGLSATPLALLTLAALCVATLERAPVVTTVFATIGLAVVALALMKAGAATGSIVPSECSGVIANAARGSLPCRV